MKKLAVVIVIGVFLSLGLYSSAFCAWGGGHGGGGHFHGGHVRHFGGPRVFIGGYFGFPYYYPYYDPYPYYPYAYSEPPVYVEPNEGSYWYYCQDAQGYYPYVTSCPGGWTKVVPTPRESGEEVMVK